MKLKLSYLLELLEIRKKNHLRELLPPHHTFRKHRLLDDQLPKALHRFHHLQQRSFFHLQNATKNKTTHHHLKFVNVLYRPLYIVLIDFHLLHLSRIYRNKHHSHPLPTYVSIRWLTLF